MFPRGRARRQSAVVVAARGRDVCSRTLEGQPPHVSEESRHPAEAWVGRVVAEKYRITRCLGIGGHGAVFEAVNTWTERRVALKLLLGAAALHPEIAERFLREARASTRVAHPNIVEVLDMGRDAADGTLYIVQELLQGEDLRDLLRRERTLDAHQLIEALAPVMDALSAAHALGIVHRDLKPANIYLARTPDGRITSKLIDFGVSRMRDSDRETNELTHTGALLGTPDYMSPEQARGERTGPQSDVWAMGIVLYESLAGQRPYRAANYNALLIKILADEVPPITSLAPGVDPVLAEIVHAALARDLTLRWRSMAALREALVRWAAVTPRRVSAGDVTPSVQQFPPLDLADPTPVSIAPPEMAAEVAPPPVAAPLSMPVSGPRVVASESLEAAHPAYGTGSAATSDDTDEAPLGEVASPIAPEVFSPPAFLASPEVSHPAPTSAPYAPMGAPYAPTSHPEATSHPSVSPQVSAPVSLPASRVTEPPRRSVGAIVLASLIALGIVLGGLIVARSMLTPTRRIENVVEAPPSAPPVAAVSARHEEHAPPAVVEVPDAAAIEARVDASTAPIAARTLEIADAAVSDDAGDRPRIARVLRPVIRPVRPEPVTRDLPESAEIRTIFNGLTPAVRGCMGTQSGTVLVAATILATGRIERVQVSAPWAGTPAGSCIVAVVNRARVAPFRQDRFTFSWPYVIPVASAAQR